MKIYLSLLFVFLSLDLRSECDFNPKIKKVISLSGVSTNIFKELGLLSRLHGISVFSPIPKNDFSGIVYPGGIHLSPKTINDFSGAVVFYDESRDLRRVFKTRSDIESVELTTRGRLPLVVVDETINKVKFFLKGCDTQVAEVQSKAKRIQNEIIEKIPSHKTIIFYLGDFISGKNPELVIVNDGVVMLLKEKNKIQTYPSDLAYVSWSSKIMNDLPQGTLHVGVKDSGMEYQMNLKRLSTNKMTLIYPGALVPGLNQLEAFLYLFKSI